jgi:hypothetical protein
MYVVRWPDKAPPQGMDGTSEGWIIEVRELTITSTKTQMRTHTERFLVGAVPCGGAILPSYDDEGGWTAAAVDVVMALPPNDYQPIRQFGEQFASLGSEVDYEAEDTDSDEC